MRSKGAIKITLIYFVVGFLWILFSDRFILSLTGSAETATLLQTYKGWLYICVTAILLYFLIRREIKKEESILVELKKAQQKAEDANMLKSAFLSNISHQVRTPLNGILGFCELIVAKDFSQEEKEVFALNMTQNCNDLIKLINDILDISKIQGNQIDLDRGVFDLNHLFDLLHAHYLKEFEFRMTGIELILVKGKPDEPFMLNSDPERLLIVFQKLISNAFYFTKQGVISFGYQITGKHIEFFVEDTGCGIDEASKEFIFKPFYTGRQQNIGNKGFGLGLAISKGLVRLLGGELNFTSAAGKGSRFFFKIEKDSQPSYWRQNEKKEGLKGIKLDEIWVRWKNS